MILFCLNLVGNDKCRMCQECILVMAESFAAQREERDSEFLEIYKSIKFLSVCRH